MKIDLDFKIKRLDGTDFIELEADGVDEKGQPKYKNSKPLTLRIACAAALSMSYPGDKDIEPLELAKRGWLAKDIFNHPEKIMEISGDTVAICKVFIAKRYSPLIILQTWEILDPEWDK